MPPERTTDVEVQGVGTASLLKGFGYISMPPNRQAAARSLIEEIVELNRVSDFRWYKPAGTNELSCYWSDSDNLLWVTPGHVHIRSDGPVSRPKRSIDWSKSDGKWVGWTLPGFVPGESGIGGSRPTVEKARCPQGAPAQPAGVECPECCEVH